MVAELAWVRQRQRHFRETERLCREALREGEAVGELRAQARACYTLDWALVELGRGDEATYSTRALEIYRELGDLENEGNVLNNLGGFAYWRGRWREAAELYREAGACAERAGSASDVADTDGNVGEILSDQGRFEEAERHLRRARRLRSSTGHVEGAAFTNMMLGRLAVRTGRAADGISLLEATAAEMGRVGGDFYADLANALVAEGEAMQRSAERALAMSTELLASVDGNVPLLRRVSGIALARLGDRDSARRELELATAAGRDRGEDYEVALALDVLAALDPDDIESRRERDEILARLDVVRLPAIRDIGEGAGGDQPLPALVASG
jgi:tetratricopeptide (TPR) repeat protein